MFVSFCCDLIGRGSGGVAMNPKSIVKINVADYATPNIEVVNYIIKRTFAIHRQTTGWNYNNLPVDMIIFIQTICSAF
ncbi:unnamed protein product [Lactuca virosa]|uniref:Uncharacterized protein n=1 Tax=Lactuca virosa TaxID=75947 RepID=A0AAU9NSH6_9ASTR|nr:unnamed protein product [Lactuca virosa]